MGEKSFDASRYLVTLKGKEYLEVKWRLLWLRTEHPDAVIETDLARLDEGYAVFKAKVSIPNGGSATGWGSEEIGDFPDFLEKAETKALGRALAALGYGTQFTEDFEFQKEGEQAVVDAPAERLERRQPAAGLPATSPAVAPTGRGGRGNGTGPASRAQVNAIYVIGHTEYHWSDEEVDSYCRNAFGKLPASLTKREASDLIDRLKATPPVT